MRFLAETGLRISELKALRWGDLRLDNEPVVRVRRRHRLLDGEQETKSERSSGTVPITPGLARALKAHRLRNGLPGTEKLVFTAGRGRRIDEANYRRRVLDSACMRAGIPPIGFHVLRHTHGSIVAAATRDVRAVQRRLRHASASFTLETYAMFTSSTIGLVSTRSHRRSKRETGREGFERPVSRPFHGFIGPSVGLRHAPESFPFDASECV